MKFLKRKKEIFLYFSLIIFTIYFFYLSISNKRNNIIFRDLKEEQGEILHLIKFKFITKHNHNESEDPISNLLLNDINIPISFGTPEQTILASLRFNDYPFFISSPSIKLKNKEDEKNIFLKNSSSSYRFISNDSLFYKSQLLEAEKANETFYFINNENNNINVSNFTFYYASKMKYNQSGGVVGLCLQDSNMNLHSGMNFLTQLKRNKIISYKTFFINYSDKEKEEGELFIGAFPHEYSKEEYKYENYHDIEGYVETTFATYGLIFDEINLGQNKIILTTSSKSEGNKRAMTVDLQIEFGFILAPSVLEENITKEFIDLYKCNAHITNLQDIYGNKLFNAESYKYYSCDISYNINSKLSFLSRAMEYNFELDQNDLFMTYGNKKYFNIIFSNNRYNYKGWIFGKPLFLKYKWVFDPDNKRFGFYIKNQTEKKDTISLMLILILIVTIVVFLIVLGIFIYFFFIKKLRKSRQNELNEEYDYNVN